MILRHAIIGLGVFATLAAGDALAQTALGEVAAAAPPQQQDMPWHQRFTLSSGETTAAWADSDTRAALSWRPSARWGVTLNVRDGDRGSVTAQDEASVGAFYQFTPSLRLGGEVSVAAPLAAAPLPGGPQEDATTAGVKLESAFRF